MFKAWGVFEGVYLFSGGAVERGSDDFFEASFHYVNIIC